MLNADEKWVMISDSGGWTRPFYFFGGDQRPDFFFKEKGPWCLISFPGHEEGKHEYPVLTNKEKNGRISIAVLEVSADEAENLWFQLLELDPKNDEIEINVTENLNGRLPFSRAMIVPESRKLTEISHFN